MAKRTLRLCQIRLDGNTQPRVELDEALVSEYKEAYLAEVQMPPLEVMFDGTDYWLWDGFHRRFGADHAGLEKLPCNVTEGTREDAQWASYGANKSHGLRRTNPDKQKAVKAALRHPTGAKKSDEMIAEHCGVSSAMVGKYRREMSPALKDLEVTTRTGRDGKTYNTANIGKPKPPADPPAEFAFNDDTDPGAEPPRVVVDADSAEADRAGVSSDDKPVDRIALVARLQEEAFVKYVHAVGEDAIWSCWLAGQESFNIQHETD